MRRCWILLALLAAGCTELLPDGDAGGDRDGGPPDAGPGMDAGEGDAGVVDGGYQPADLRFVATGYRHTCAATEERIYCWGYGQQGQIGDGSFRAPDELELRPVETRPVPPPIHGLYGGPDGTCVVAGVGRELYCWGNGDFERFAVVGDTAEPTLVNGSADVTDVGISSQSMCFVAGGNLRCVGNNGSGALGIGTTGGRFGDPQAVSLVGPALRVAMSSDQPGTGCAVVSAGGGNEVYCWGNNRDLQAGQDAATTELTSPTLVDGLLGARDVALSHDFGCALSTGGDVDCWGENGDGQLGDGRADSPVPMPVPLGGVTLESLELGYRMAVGVAVGLTEIHGWGDTTDGRLGVAERAMPLPPSRLDGESGASAVRVSTRGEHTCVLARYPAGPPRLRCTGYNFRGQLGTGDTMSRSAFTEIAVP